VLLSCPCVAPAVSRTGLSGVGPARLITSSRSTIWETSLPPTTLQVARVRAIGLGLWKFACLDDTMGFVVGEDPSFANDTVLVLDAWLSYVSHSVDTHGSLRSRSMEPRTTRFNPKRRFLKSVDSQKFEELAELAKYGGKSRTQTESRRFWANPAVCTQDRKIFMRRRFDFRPRHCY